MNEKEIYKIRNNYLKTEESNLDKLKKLDKKVKKPISIFAYIFGCIASLVFGTGMCVAMGIIFESFFWLGIIVGVFGMFLMLLNYIIYKSSLEHRKKKYSSEIIELSNKLLNE